jgi:hypothetical protein
VVFYFMGTPARRRARLAAEAAEATADASRTAAPHGGGQSAGDTVASERKEV